MNALRKDDWTVTHQHYRLIIDARRLYIDLRAEKINEQLAVLIEIKGFENSPSMIEVLAEAVGKYVLYQVVLESMDITTSLYLAVPRAAYDGILQESIGKKVLQRVNM